MTGRTWAEAAGGLALGILIIAFNVEAGKARAAHLETLNAKAAADSGERYQVGQLQVATRLMLQGQIDLAAALKRPASQATSTVTVTVYRDTSHATTTGTSPDSGVYRGEYHQAGVDVLAVVQPPVWHWRVAVDPVPITVALSCGKDGSASATVSGPTWAGLSLSHLQQEARVCNPPPGWSLLSLKPPSAPWAGALVLLGYVLGHR